MCLALRPHLIHLDGSRPRSIVGKVGGGPVKEPTGSVTDPEEVVGCPSGPLVQSCSAGQSACRMRVFVFVCV